jgi:hypothetical protein
MKRHFLEHDYSRLGNLGNGKVDSLWSDVPSDDITWGGAVGPQTFPISLATGATMRLRAGSGCALHDWQVQSYPGAKASWPFAARALDCPALNILGSDSQAF